ncbi:hypothetical protein K402DRAFT_322060 [Aulographum hederae CBS 113979]|uniref:Uncharacterized protein n=1 Tax=Aulographum hederae CBS 113979 TaxID=1176131 RepID=A0A6G1HFP8_9PEZI|nr:hypothetical protein K402DRAFT_322060 [Aulographum hederae CBS 113979]
MDLAHATTYPVTIEAQTSVANVAFGGSSLTAIYDPSSTGLLLPNGQTLAAGSPTAIDGTTISFDTSASFAAVNGVTQPLQPSLVLQSTSPAATVIAAAAIVISDGSTLATFAFAGTSSAGIVLPGGQTLAPGQETVAQGTTYSLSPSEAVAVVNGVTANLYTVTYAPQSAGIYLANGDVLAPGHETEVDGTTYSLAPSETAVVINGVTAPLAPPVVTPYATEHITLGSSIQTVTYAPSSAGIILPNGEVLVPGYSTEVSGTMYSLSPSEIAVVVDGQTAVLHPGVQETGSAAVVTIDGSVVTLSHAGGPKTTNSVDVGGYINSGLGGGASTASGNGTEEFTGDAMGLKSMGRGIILASLGTALISVFMSGR